MKNLTKYLGVFALVLFSFYYTDGAVEIIKRNDPVMKNILEDTESYKLESVSAVVEENTIIPGMNGLEVDVDESYKKMKSVNGYYESMLTLKEVIPEESILNQYDKFVIHGNPYRSDVALLIKVDNINNLEKVHQILLEKEILATFFVDGEILENNLDLMQKVASDGFELENFGYNDVYQEVSFNWTNNMLFSITNEEPKFCYAEYHNYDILDLCSKNKMHTVIPTTVVKTTPFYTIKENLEEGSIFSLDLTSTTIKELPTIITYIKQKGFNLVTLEEIISEEREVEK